MGFREGTILNSVEGGEEKTSVEVKPYCYVNSSKASPSVEVKPYC
jgi:hypothetical protein